MLAEMVDYIPQKVILKMGNKPFATSMTHNELKSGCTNTDTL